MSGIFCDRGTSAWWFGCCCKRQTKTVPGNLISRSGLYPDLQEEITEAPKLSDEAVVLIIALTITVVLPSASIILYLGYQFYTRADKTPCQMR